MLRGIYSAASGMTYQMEQVNQIANNLANVDTNGFKRNELLAASFGDLVVQMSEHAPGTESTIGTGVKIDGVARFETQGNLVHTGGRLNMAINGPGYFLVRGADGTEKLTRDGDFQLDANQRLITRTGDLVLNGTHRPIVLTGDLSTMRVSENGSLFVNEVVQDQLMVTNPPAAALASSFPAAPPGLQPISNPVVAQGMLEHSNVNIVTEMVNMLTASRAFGFGQKVISAHDQILQKTANDLGRMS